MKRNSSSPVHDDCDDAPVITADLIAGAKRRIGLADVEKKEWREAVNEKLGKQRVTIMLDASIVAWFKAQAGTRGYQTLINSMLHGNISRDAVIYFSIELFRTPFDYHQTLHKRAFLILYPSRFFF